MLLLAGAMTGYSQTVNFANNILTSPPDRLVRQSDGTPLRGVNYIAVLLYGTSDSSMVAHTATARFRAVTTTLPGTWQDTGPRTLTGVPSTPGSVVRLAVAVFDNTQFANYAAAVAGGGVLGRSAQNFDYTIPTEPPGPGTDSMVNFAGFTLVPEPSVIGLGLIGVGALFMLRRRK